MSRVNQERRPPLGFIHVSAQPIRTSASATNEGGLSGLRHHLGSAATQSHVPTRSSVRSASVRPVRPDELERRLRERLDALGPAPCAELLHVLMLPDFDRADAIGSYWGNPQDPNLRRTPDRLRGGPDAPGCARGDAGEIGHQTSGRPHQPALTRGSSCEYRMSAIRLAMMTAAENSRNRPWSNGKSFESIACTVSWPRPG